MGKPTYDELKEKYDNLIDEQVQNNFIIEELSNRIYSAINYINRHTYLDSYSPKYNEKYYGLDDSFEIDILNKILRGVK